jgi:hypothetical protein
MTRYHDRWIVGGLLVGAMLTLACWAQPPSEDPKQLQTNIQEMQKRLDAIRKAEEDADTRTRRIGKSKGAHREDLDNVMVVRIYDISDLFTPAPAYRGEELDPWTGKRTLAFPAPETGSQGSPLGGMGGMGGMGGGFFSILDPDSLARGEILAQHRGDDAGALGSARTSLSSLIEAITDIIEPDSWEENGGPGRISAIGATILISAKDEVHDQVDELLDVFRRRWGSQRTVTTEVWWLWLTPDELGKLVADPTAPQSPVADDVWTSMWNVKAKQDPAPRQAKMTGFNGQTIFTSAGEVHTVAKDWKPVVIGKKRTDVNEIEPNDEEPLSAFTKGDLRIGLVPNPAALNEGIGLQVTPLTSISGKYATLDLHSRVIEAVAEPEKKEEAQMPFRRESVRVHRLSTTVRIPVGSVVLVGGSTFQGSPKADEPSLYLFTRLSMQELRDERMISGNPMAKPNPAVSPPQGEKKEKPE